MTAVVDILLPVFNGASTIGAAVRSLQKQTFSNFRMIIIDDGSTDRTWDILSDLASRDTRIIVFRKNNQGIVGALNAGLEVCRSEFVARQDADDISEPTRLEQQLAYMKTCSDCIAVSGAIRHIDEVGQPIGTIQHFAQTDHADPFWVPAREPYLVHPFLLIRRSALAAVGGYRYVYHSEDTDLYWRLLEHGRLHNLNNLVGQYRMHAQSVSGSSVINGRIMALSSQLAALSARRRREGLSDIQFPKDAITEYRKAQSLDALCATASVQLDEKERCHLRMSVAAKLVELAAYRPYELEIEDCQFIRRTLMDAGSLKLENQRELKRMQAAAGARLFGHGMAERALALTPPGLYFGALARLALAPLPGWARRSVNRLHMLTLCC
jgi:Glycosyl transferase family 2